MELLDCPLVLRPTARGSIRSRVQRKGTGSDLIAVFVLILFFYFFEFLPSNGNSNL